MLFLVFIFVKKHFQILKRVKTINCTRQLQNILLSVKKNNHSVFVIFWKLCQNINKKNYFSVIFWTFKSKLQIIYATAHVAHFLPDSNNPFFFIFLAPYVPICPYYFLILCFYFHLLSHPVLATRHILQFTMLASISLQPARNISEIKNTSQSTTKKNFRVNHNQPNALTFS